MAQMEIGSEEVEVLEGVLQTYLYDLSREISHTDNRAFRDGLKEKAIILKGFLERLPAISKSEARKP